MKYFIFAFSILLGNQAFAQSCKGCEELSKIKAAYLAKGADQEKFESLQVDGAAVVEKMPEAKSRKLTKDQIKSIVDFMRVALPKDPARAFTMNIDLILKENRKAFEAEVAKLPKSEAQDILDAISYAVDVEGLNQDPTPNHDKLEAAPLGSDKKQPATK